MLYKQILEAYCAREYGYDDTWEFKSNILAVSTIGECESRVFPVTPGQLKEGQDDINKLLKMVAYYDIFGDDTEVNFI